MRDNIAYIRKAKIGGRLGMGFPLLFVKKFPLVACLAEGTELLLIKTGLFKSLAATLKRRSDKRTIDAPSVGTPVLVSLERGVAEHSGIYLGDSQVAELSGDGKLQIVTLTDFVNGQDESWSNFRLGTCVYAACDSRTAESLGTEEIAISARKLVSGIGEVDYHLFGNNCHMFTASCLLDRMQRKMTVVEWLKQGTYTIEDLNDVIGRIMNLNDPIAWLRVKGPSKGFEYALTKEKIERLKKEGLYEAGCEG